MLKYNKYERFRLLHSLKTVSPHGYNVTIKRLFTSETEHNFDPYNKSDAIHRYYGIRKTCSGKIQNVNYPKEKSRKILSSFTKFNLNKP